MGEEPIWKKRILRKRFTCISLRLQNVQEKRSAVLVDLRVLALLPAAVDSKQYSKQYTRRQKIDNNRVHSLVLVGFSRLSTFKWPLDPDTTYYLVHIIGKCFLARKSLATGNNPIPGRHGQLQMLRTLRKVVIAIIAVYTTWLGWQRMHQQQRTRVVLFLIQVTGFCGWRLPLNEPR